MLYCTGMNANASMFLIQDTDDKGTEYIPRNMLLKYISQGAIIQNLYIDYYGGTNVTDVTYINNLLEEFKRKASTNLIKMGMLKKLDSEKVNKVTEIAYKLGLIPAGFNLEIDVNGCKVALPFQGFIYNFSITEGVEDSERIISVIDVCDPKVVELSHIGFQAFDFMTLNIGDKKNPIIVKLSDCFNEIRLYDDSFNNQEIKYIGITPSNKMFKIYFSPWKIYSVQFTNGADLRENYAKIDKLGTTDGHFSRYLYRKQYSAGVSDICIAKVSRKQYNLDVKGLKAKYKTLQDVYVQG